MDNYNLTKDVKPPKDTPIEWVSPGGQVEKGKWLGGMVWMPEGSDMYVYYTPVYWRKL